MKPSAQTHSRVRSTLARIAFVFAVLALTLLIGGIVAGAAALRSLKLPAEMSTLREELLTCLDAERLSSVEITIPGWVTTVGRAGIALADVDPEVKAALQAVGGGQVGVYQLAEQPSHEKVRAMLDLADLQLEDEGWTRMVTVLDPGESVAVYGLDSSMRDGRALDIFVVVLNRQELVMVSARSYPKPLLELASAQLADVRLGERLR